MPRIITPVTDAQARVLAGCDTAPDRLRTGAWRRGCAAGPIGSGRLTWDGNAILWTRNPATVHASLLQLSIETGI